MKSMEEIQSLLDSNWMVDKPGNEAKWSQLMQDLYSELPLEPLVTSGLDLDTIYEQIKAAQSLLESPSLSPGNAGDFSNESNDEMDDQEISENDMMEVAPEFEDDMSDDEGEEFEEDFEKESDEEMPSEIEEEMPSDIEEKEEEEEEEQVQEKKSLKKSTRKSIVDDAFFSLADMESFAEKAEARDLKRAEDSDEEEDEFSLPKEYFEQDPDDIEMSDEEEDDENDNANDIMYEDFFGPRDPSQIQEASPSFDAPSWSKKSPQPLVQHEEEDDIEEEEFEQDMEEEESTKGLISQKGLFDEDQEQDLDEPQSTFEKQQSRLQNVITKLELDAMAAKPWTLKGEASSKSRPQNSLLDTDLEVDTASKPVPVITEETTKTLADLITQRIKDRAWDDVERKVIAAGTLFDPNRRMEMQDQKSSKSLSQLYEDDYAKTKGPVLTEKDVKLQKEQEEVNILFANVCKSLDALSNWHYTPKAALMELEVIPLPNVPAISMEEAIPAHVGDGSLAAPKEVYETSTLKSQQEMDTKEKNAARKRAKASLGQAKDDRRVAREAKTKQLEAMGIKPKVHVQVSMDKAAAVKSLSRQSNVTIIGGKGVGKKTNAKMVKKGDSLKKVQKVFKSEMLKL